MLSAKLKSLAPEACGHSLNDCTEIKTMRSALIKSIGHYPPGSSRAKTGRFVTFFTKGCQGRQAAPFPRSGERMERGYSFDQ